MFRPAAGAHRRSWERIRRIGLALAALLALLYAAAIGVLYVAQRSLLYPGSQPGAEAAAVVIPGGERIALATPDGERLAAWYVPPDPRRPVFLFLHGNGGALEAQAGRWSRLRQAGAGVLALSFRGYPGSTGRPSESALHADARLAYDWLRQRFDAGRIVVHGNSLGTGLAVRLAAAVPVRALVLEAPFTAAVDVASERYPWVPVSLLMTDQFRSRDWASEVRAPVLIVHGDQDRTVPFAHAERLLQMIKAPKQLVRMPGSGHNTLVRDGLYPHVWAFLDQHGPPAP